MSHWLSTRPGVNAYGPAGQEAYFCMTFRSRTPMTMSHDPSLDWPQPAYHHPYTRSAVGGRSPAMRVVLVPSVTSVRRVSESLNNTPSFVDQSCPPTPRNDVNATSRPGRFVPNAVV